jgi:hypothetical protein
LAIRPILTDCETGAMENAAPSGQRSVSDLK